MKSLFTDVLDIFFPPSPEQLIVRSFEIEETNALLSVGNAQGILYLSHFNNPTVRALVHEAKFHRNHHAILVLGRLLRQFLEQHPHPANTLIIPIPLSKARKRERGYNQVEEIVKSAVADPEFSLSLDSKTLMRTKHTKPQTDLPREKRLENAKGAFAVSDPKKLNGAHILLIDDVFTTGATMRAAKAALLPPALSVTCIALAH